ncbi:MAG TPA: protein-glutamate O-methyltransferase CheR [Longimicrobiales bacterium]|nr:protein-glutamate O-methyltransferase CheR [Longimicrobiales bacterium]
MPSDEPGGPPPTRAAAPPRPTRNGQPATGGLPELSRLLPLAHGELTLEQTAELASLKAQIQAGAGVVCAGYKESCLRRRLAVRMRARGLHRYTDYGALLDEDPAEYESLLRTLTINVSRFFRNAEVWEAVRDRVLPELATMPSPILNLWSAATAAGEEAYTLAILLRQRAATDPSVELERFRVVGTDIDEEVLAAAARAQYGALSFADTAPQVRERWFTPGYPARLHEDIRTMVRFWPLDLMVGPYPRMQHLIVCRNVIIYFERHVQEQIFRRFAEALVPGGYLVLGKVETTVGDAAAAFESVSPAERIYRRV